MMVLAWAQVTVIQAKRQNSLASLLDSHSSRVYADQQPGGPHPLGIFLEFSSSHGSPATFGTAAAYYTDYRQQRRPQENLNFGRTFQFTERISFSIRGEFSNIFNRAFIASVGTGAAAVGGTPTINNLTNATTTVQVRNPNGTTASGFGALLNVAPIAPRQGNIVARITF